jgi:hypothetical protein
MSDWLLSDPQLVTAAILGVVLVVLIVTAFRKSGVTRKEFALLQKDVKRLSEKMQELQAAEQRRFLKELNASEKTIKCRLRRPNPPPTALSSEQYRDAREIIHFHLRQRKMRMLS